MGRFSPAQLIVFSFFCAILVGTGLLSLPHAAQDGERLSLIDSLFTATSAICVTGLTVKDTGSFFSPFGKWVICALIQLGGLGIMTFSTLFAIILGRRIGFHEWDVARNTFDKQGETGLRSLILYILGITLAVEMVGAALLFLRWKTTTGWTGIDTMEMAVFHSISGFCNAGFSLFENNLSDFRGDVWINLIMMAIIIFGGLGFIVVMDIISFFTRKEAPKTISLQTKVVLGMTLLLVVIGAGMIIFFEKGGIMQGMSWRERLLGGFFQSVTARTAGFNTIDIGQLSIPSLLVIMFLMFIGASPGSTGGGIKTCTFVVILITIISIIKNRKRTRIFGRSVPHQVVREAIVIVFLSLFLIFVSTVIFSYFQGKSIPGGGSLLQNLFEVVSAFGTVGLSTGLTEHLADGSKACLVVTMFIGRVGPLTLALAVALRKMGKDKDDYAFPEENIMVG